MASTNGDGKPPNHLEDSPTAEAEARRQFQLGLRHQRDNHLEDAEAMYRGTLALSPRFALAHGNLGTVLLKMGRLAEAESCIRDAIALAPRDASLLYNLANVLRLSDRSKEAEYYYRRSLSVDPGFTPALNNLGNLLARLGRLDEAEQCYHTAIAIEPTRIGRRHNLGQLQLLRGNFADGWPNFEARLFAEHSEPKWRGLPDRTLLWRGQSLRDTHLLVWSELGFGDTLQFVRYVPFLAKTAARVTLAVQASLIDLLRNSLPGDISIIDRESVTPEGWNRHVSLLSLPGILDVHLDRYRWSEPCLRIARPRPRTDFGLPEDCRLIGVVWASSPGHAQLYRHKSIDVKRLINALLKVRGIIVLSLQLGRDAAQIRPFLGPRVMAQKWNAASFENTAELVSVCDGVVTVDTAMAHLAGGLGVPTWTLLQFVPDWRWGLRANRSYWYPRMHLLRQHVPGEWNAPLDELVQSLSAKFSLRS